MTRVTTRDVLPFRWKYILLPVSVLFLSILLCAYFYHLLPGEVAYHFRADGSPDKWLSREMVVAWTLVPQLLFTLMAGCLAWGITRLGARFGKDRNTKVEPEKILLLIGNMVVLPQLILCFAMLDIFSYNSYQMHIMPVWLFALIVMVVGGIILGVLFVRIIRQVWRATGGTIQRKV